MNGKQYKNVIDWTLQHDNTLTSADSLTVARAILKNMGIALPQGDMKKVNHVMRTNRFMEWRPIKLKEAQAAANSGLAVVGVDEERVVLLNAVTEDTTNNTAENVAVMTLSETTPAYDVNGLSFYSYGTMANRSTTECPCVEIPQNGNIGTSITYMGYHLITSKSSNQYKLKAHANNSGKYSIANPQYYALINGRMVIATKENIGGQLQVAIGDYVDVRFKREDGVIITYMCIIGDIKGADAPNIWGHDDGKSVVEMIYHDYSPPPGYNYPKNNPWGKGRVLRITKVGSYGNYY